MKSTTYPGIDYSAGQPINRNVSTGIRYGIIPVNDCNSDAIEDIYSNGTDTDYEDWKQAIIDGIKSALSDYLSERAIQRVIDNGLDDIGEDYESTGDCTRYEYESDGYKLRIDGSGNLWVFESPYFTYAQFCSPCAPGACYLRSPLECDSLDARGNPMPEGASAISNKCYCLGHDWFEDGRAPYTVFSVKTGEVVQPAEGSAQ